MPRLPRPDEHGRRSQGPVPSPGQGPQAPRPDHPHQGAVEPAGARFPRAARLRASTDFQRVHAHGRRLRLGCLTLVAAPGTAARSRVGLAVGRRVGGAVERNRVKRWIREASRRRLSSLRGVWDLVFVASPHALAAGADGIAAEVARGLARLEGGSR